MKKIVGIVVLVLLVGIVGSIIIPNFLTKPTAIEAEEVIDNKNISTIDINTNNEDVELKTTSDSTIRVELTGKSKQDGKDILDVTVEGETLLIETVKQNRLFSIDFFDESRELTVHLPENVYEALLIDSDNGSVQANRVNSKKIQAETDNGQIKMENSEASIVNVTSDNGSINLKAIEGKINGKTNNGSISLVTTSLDRSIELESDNGNIKVETEQAPTNATFDVKVDNGKVTIFDETNWESIVGDGDNLIKLTTNNGNITVAK